MAARIHSQKELIGPALGEWAETKRVFLPGGGTMYLPIVFTAVSGGKEQSPKYLWRGEPDAGSIEVELISYYAALRLDQPRFTRMMQDRIEPNGGTLIGDLETLRVGGYETFYRLFHVSLDATTNVARYGAYARILTRNAGVMFAATHADQQHVDRLAKAVLSTLTV